MSKWKEKDSAVFFEYNFISPDAEKFLIANENFIDWLTKIEGFKSYRIDKPPLEIIEHYKEKLGAMQDALDIISGRWKMQIIALLCNGEFRYSELEKGLPKISPRMLSKELKDLEINELVERKVYDSETIFCVLEERKFKFFKINFLRLTFL